MLDLFDKTFFRFAIGFMLIISASFAVMAFSGYYQDSVNASIGDQAIQGAGGVGSVAP